MLKEKVAASIRALYPDADTGHLLESCGRVTGYVVDKAFTANRTREVNDKIWQQIAWGPRQALMRRRGQSNDCLPTGK